MLSKYKKELQQNKELYLRIKVHPGAPKSSVREIMIDETVKIDVAAVPERGKANEELIKYLAKEFSTNKTAIKIICGAGDRVKLVKIILN